MVIVHARPYIDSNKKYFIVIDSELKIIKPHGKPHLGIHYEVFKMPLSVDHETSLRNSFRYISIL